MSGIWEEALRVRREQFADTPHHYYDAPFRTYGVEPPEYDSPQWQQKVTLAVIDALTSEGVPAWNGDAVCCVVQIIEAYAKLAALRRSVAQEK